MDDSELLTLIEDAIRLRTAAGAVEEHSEGAAKFKHTPLSDLIRMRRDLRQAIAASSSGGYRLYQESSV